MKKTQKEILAFLKAIQKVCKKHDMYFGGCGCCGSPFIVGGDGFIPLAEKVDMDSKDIDFFIKGKKIINDKVLKDKDDIF